MAGRVFGDEMVMLAVGLYVRIATLNPLLGRNVYLGLTGETGQAWSYQEKPGVSDLLVGGTVFLGAETLLGPIYLGYGFVEQGYDSAYLMLGRTF